MKHKTKAKFGIKNGENLRDLTFICKDLNDTSKCFVESLQL